MRFHFHRWSPLAPLGDYEDRWFKMCLRGKCTQIRIVAKR